MDTIDNFINTLRNEESTALRLRIIKNYINTLSSYNDLVPYLPLLVGEYYDFGSLVGITIGSFPATIISEWFNTGSFSGKFVDAVNEAIYNVLLIPYSPNEAIDIIKRGTIALTNANISNELLEKLRYDVPYGSFDSEEELRNYGIMYPTLLSRKYYVASRRRREELYE